MIGFNVGDTVLYAKNKCIITSEFLMAGVVVVKDIKTGLLMAEYNYNSYRFKHTKALLIEKYESK